MVDVKEVEYLKGERLLVEVVQLVKGDAKPNALEGHCFLPLDDLVEWRLARVQSTQQDAHLI